MEEKSQLLARYYAEQRHHLVEIATRWLQGDIMTAEDVVQTTFLRLLTSERMISAITLPALTKTTMHNLLRDIWRKREHEKDYEHTLSIEWRRKASDDVFSVCSASQINSLLEKKMAKMEDSVGRVLKMNIIEGKAVSEISEELNTKYKTVENKLLYGRKQIRAYLRKVI